MDSSLHVCPRCNKASLMSRYRLIVVDVAEDISSVCRAGQLGKKFQAVRTGPIFHRLPQDFVIAEGALELREHIGSHLRWTLHLVVDVRLKKSARGRNDPVWTEVVSHFPWRRRIYWRATSATSNMFALSARSRVAIISRCMSALRAFQLATRRMGKSRGRCRRISDIAR